MMIADKYIEVIQHKVVKDMEKTFPNGGGNHSELQKIVEPMPN